jgi:hypothetical protein
MGLVVTDWKKGGGGRLVCPRLESGRSRPKKAWEQATNNANGYKADDADDKNAPNRRMSESRFPRKLRSFIPPTTRRMQTSSLRGIERRSAFEVERSSNGCATNTSSKQEVASILTLCKSPSKHCRQSSVRW